MSGARANSNANGGKSKIKCAKQCGRCGSEYKRPKPDPESRAFPSARAVRAVRNKRKADSETDTASTPFPQESGPSNMASIVSTPVSTSSDTLQVPPPPQIQTTATPLPHADTTNTTNSPFQVPGPPPPPPKYVHHHNLIHVHTSSPHPPTYTQPPPAKNLSPPPKEKSKKRKKSGLARLLAENKEREMGGGAGGGWGLD